MPTIRDTFTANDSLGSVNLTLPPLRESFTASDAPSTTLSVTLRDSFTANDTPAGDSYVTVRDRFTADDRTTSIATISLTVRDRFTANDTPSARAYREEIVSEPFTVSDRVASVTVRAALRDRFTVSDSQVTQGADGLTVRDRFTISDAPQRVLSFVLRDQFTITDSAAVAGTLRVSVRDQFTVDDRTTETVGGAVTVRDRFTATDRTTPTARIAARIREWFSVNDVTHSRVGRPALGPKLLTRDVPVSETDVWTADMEGWGMSRYARFPVTDFVGTRFGVGEGGVFTADTECGFSYMTTGLIRFDQPKYKVFEKKRLNYVYSYSAHSAPLQVAVTADLRGKRVEMEYRQEPRNSEDTRAARCQVGRGFATNYIGLQIGGPPFDMAALEVQTVTSNRRV